MDTKRCIVPLCRCSHAVLQSALAVVTTSRRMSSEIVGEWQLESGVYCVYLRITLRGAIQAEQIAEIFAYLENERNEP